MKDLKIIYQAETLELAEFRLGELEEKWGKNYEKVLECWRRNWSKPTTYFRYDAAVRKSIYTTNTIEGFPQQVRKVTKTTGASPQIWRC